MAENLDDILRRAAQTKVTRRGFLAAAGLPAGSAALAACGTGCGAAAPRRPRRQRLGAARRRAAAAAPAARSRRSCSCTTGRTTSTPKNMDEFKAEFGVEKFQYDTYANNEELLAKLQAGASGYDIACPTAEYCPGMVEGGYIPKLDRQPDPEPEVHQPDLQGPVVGPDRRVPAAQGLRHDRRPVPQRSSFERALTSWQEFFDLAKGEVLGQGRPRRLDGRRVRLPAQDAGQLAQLGRAGGPRGGARDPARARAARPRARLRHVRGQAGQRGGRAGPRLDRAARRAAREPRDGRRRVHGPERGHAVLARHVGHAGRRAEPERRVRVARTSSTSPEIQAEETNYNRYATPNDEAKKFIDPDDPERPGRSSRPRTSWPTSRAPRTPRATSSGSTSGRSSSRPIGG